ncbi:MAG: OmpH family outer membrane protein [Alistipes sp.]|jgi:outer membrane protein|nr:OmpH family outer membrane protein [Alistipes sp.]
MKKVLTIALAMFALASCKNAGTGADAAATAENSVETVYDIAYISMDSLINGYGRYKDLSSEFEAKATRIQNDLEARARSLQNEVVNFQDQVQRGLMTRTQAEQKQSQIESRGQQFEADRQARLTELAEEEQVMTNQIMYAISEYVASFNSDFRYKMILTSSGTAPVIHAAPSLNITSEVLDGLNAAYAAEKNAAAK